MKFSNTCNYVLQSMKIAFMMANSADPDEMPHLEAFHLGLHCLPKYPFRGFQKIQRVDMFLKPLDKCRVLNSFLFLNQNVLWVLKRTV